jgi:hypothetical protein
MEERAKRDLSLLFCLFWLWAALISLSRPCRRLLLTFRVSVRFRWWNTPWEAQTLLRNCYVDCVCSRNAAEDGRLWIGPAPWSIFTVSLECSWCDIECRKVRVFFIFRSCFFLPFFVILGPPYSLVFIILTVVDLNNIGSLKAIRLIRALRAARIARGALFNSRIYYTGVSTEEFDTFG